MRRRRRTLCRRPRPSHRPSPHRPRRPADEISIGFAPRPFQSQSVSGERGIRIQSACHVASCPVARRCRLTASPPGPITTLSGLRSRCATPFSSRYLTPSTICQIRLVDSTANASFLLAPLSSAEDFVNLNGSRRPRVVCGGGRWGEKKGELRSAESERGRRGKKSVYEDS